MFSGPVTFTVRLLILPRQLPMTFQLNSSRWLFGWSGAINPVTV